MRNLISVYGPFFFKNISQELVRMSFFLFSLIGEAFKWLPEFPRDSITSWDELITPFEVQLFPPSKMMTLQDNIQSIKSLEGGPIHETWLRL